MNQNYEILPFGALDRRSPLRELLNSALELASWEPSFSWAPRNQILAVHEDEEKVIVRLKLAGMAREDFEIELKDGVLTISAHRRWKRKEGEGEPLRRERFFGEFSRDVRLPAKVEESAASASYQEGVLTVTLPKAEEAKPKKIEIHSNSFGA